MAQPNLPEHNHEDTGGGAISLHVVGDADSDALYLHLALILNEGQQPVVDDDGNVIGTCTLLTEHDIMQLVGSLLESHGVITTMSAMSHEERQAYVDGIKTQQQSPLN